MGNLQLLEVVEYLVGWRRMYFTTRNFSEDSFQRDQPIGTSRLIPLKKDQTIETSGLFLTESTEKFRLAGLFGRNPQKSSEL